MRDRHPEVKLSVTASTLAAARFRSLSVTCAAIFANDLWAIWRAHHGRTVLSANKRLFLLVLLHALTQRHVRCESLLVLSLLSLSLSLTQLRASLLEPTVERGMYLRIQLKL